MSAKAVIAMSGGVDSSVAALLMKMRGCTCMGATMKLFHNEDIGLCREHTCCSLEDVEDARSVAYALGMPYYVFNFSDRFRRDVIDRFVAAYEIGVTPNPCIDCNRYLKFDKLFQRMAELEYDWIVTGHYARTEYDAKSGRYLLKRAVDGNKDQSYVLWTITQEQLAHVRFPLGGMRKAEVRALAEAHGLINAGKHDSQDICFVQNGSYADFIEQYTGKTYPPGDFVDMAGRVLGRHRGVIHYTVGQRRGLGLALEEPMYVQSIDPAANTVTLCAERELYTRRLTAGDINLIAVPELCGAMRVQAKVRYRQPAQWATATQTAPGRFMLEFDEPQRAVTRGQSAVLYDGDLVIGGGIIESTE